MPVPYHEHVTEKLYSPKGIETPDNRIVTWDEITEKSDRLHKEIDELRVMLDSFREQIMRDYGKE